MSAIKVDRGPGMNPWLFHASTIEEVDEYLSSSTTRHIPEITDQLLDLRLQLRALETPE